MKSKKKVSQTGPDPDLDPDGKYQKQRTHPVGLNII